MKIVNALLAVMVLMFSSVTFAKDQYMIDPQGTIVHVEVTPKICEALKSRVALITYGIEAGDSDQDIIDKAYNVAMSDLSKLDRWIATNMAAKQAFIGLVRSWPNTKEIAQLRQQTPGKKTAEYNMIFGDTICKSMIGSTVPVLNVLVFKPKGITM